MPENPISAVARLLDRYLLDLDDEKLDDEWAERLFTVDACVEFPMSRHAGRAGLAAYHRDALAKFAATQHLSSPAAVTVRGDTAALRANLVSTHVLAGESDGPPALFTAGTFVTGEARRTAAGWRLRRLSFRLVWASGSPRPAG
jgi:hypothetical protein